MPVAIPGLPRTATSIVDLIGNTPLIRLSTFEAGLRNVELYAKAEWKNPGGSVKDRPALRMIQDGEKSGALTRDKVVLDATSGNTGIAYAMIGAARGYRVKLCVPSNVTPERKRILKAFGAEIVFTDPMQGSDGAILKAREMFAAEDLGVSTEDAFELTRQLARSGLFVGISSGANLVAALDVARRSPDSVIVVIFPDGGEKYLSERFWDEVPDVSGADAKPSGADLLAAPKPRSGEGGGPR